MVIPALPIPGPLFEDTSGKGDIHLRVSAFAVMGSAAVPLVVGVVSGMVPVLLLATLFVSRPVLDPDRGADKPKRCANLVFQKSLIREVQLHHPIGEQNERRR